MKCARCGKENPAEIHTCTPLALKLADKLEAEVKRTVSLDILHNDAAIELQRLHAENEALLGALKDMCKGFHHLDDSDFPALARARDVIARAGESK